MQLFRFVVFFLMVILFAPQAFANLCKSKHVTNRHVNEAGFLTREVFSHGNYGGDRGYNSRIIGCNRKRDQKGNNIEKAITGEHVFGDELSPKVVRGMYNYWGDVITSKSYGYQLGRESGLWIATVPIRFHLPKLKLLKYLDIPMELAEDLGLVSGPVSEVCAEGNTRRSGGKIVRGFIENKWGYKSCRVRKNEPIPGRGVSWTPDVWVMDFWKRKIEKYWSHSGFELRAPVWNFAGEINDIRYKKFKKAGIVWHVRFNMNKNVMPRYKGSIIFPHPLYIGLDSKGIVHEFGHQLGLDDEYGNKSKKDCWNLYPAVATQYIMCDPFSPETRILQPSQQKAVYDWIVTRRYAIAEEYPCKNTSDCDADEFCAKHGLNRNVCETRRPEGADCGSKDEKCARGLVCAGKPAGKCVAPASVAVGGRCVRNAQCTSGSCNSKSPRRCQCKVNRDCTDGYCDTGTLSVGVNRCVPFKDYADHCSADKQCEFPAICRGKPTGRCVTPNSRSIGEGCIKDVQCRQGKCGSNHRCVCTEDWHCSSGKCKKPIGKHNYCQ